MDSSVANANITIFLKKQHENGPVPPGLNEVCQFCEIVIGITRAYLSSMGDNCEKLEAALV